MKEDNVAQSAQTTFDEDAIRDLVSIRAYELFTGRGGEHGRDIDDWLRAEQEVFASLSGTETMKAQEAITADRPEATLKSAATLRER
ncbi:MAG: DUF2934 domain-containing protein [Acidobacteriota bacterium]